MGFYGNITNTSRTQFQFDRTYPNRRVMDSSAKSDGMFPDSLKASTTSRRFTILARF